VNSGQRWYLVAWDIDREDWRTFRVDRMVPGMSPGPRFTPRPLSDADVEALISQGVPPTSRRFQARITVHAPAAALADRIGPWIGTLTAVDDRSCVLDTGADSLEMLAVYLGLLGVDFTVTEPSELVERIQALGERYSRATASGLASL
jgi:predicted DNA-binding transcriptional regulator YafY